MFVCFFIFPIPYRQGWGSGEGMYPSPGQEILFISFQTTFSALLWFFKPHKSKNAGILLFKRYILKYKMPQPLGSVSTFFDVDPNPAKWIGVDPYPHLKDCFILQQTSIGKKRIKVKLILCICIKARWRDLSSFFNFPRLSAVNLDKSEFSLSGKGSGSDISFPELKKN